MDQKIEVRPIEPRDDEELARIIRAALAEYEIGGPGAVHADPDLDAMCSSHGGERAAYFVAEGEGGVLGGAGIAPLVGADAETCELRRMYLAPEARGRGLGARLLERCLEEARRLGFRRCYLETHPRMVEAVGLYTSRGFRPLDAPLGETGYSCCTTWATLDL